MSLLTVGVSSRMSSCPGTELNRRHADFQSEIAARESAQAVDQQRVFVESKVRSGFVPNVVPSSLAGYPARNPGIRCAPSRSAERWSTEGVMVKMFVMLALLAVGCVTETNDWQPGTHPRAVLADGAEDPVWTVMVDRAHEKWAVALAAVGCADPFDGDAEHLVELIPVDQWSQGPATGYQTADMIGVKGTVHDMLLTSAYETVLPHELGHALGLAHVEPADDPLSVMISPAPNTVPSMLDVQHAAANLGCL